jgi:ribA/ribD-fused uncharacterized protein
MNFYKAIFMIHYNLKWLQDKSDKGDRIDYLFFWGHTNNNKETLGNFIFSQWYPSPFVIDGMTYKTAEHWMMVAKAKLFNDLEALDKIIRAETPKEAKDLGRGVSGFIPEVWEHNSYQTTVTK